MLTRVAVVVRGAERALTPERDVLDADSQVVEGERLDGRPRHRLTRGQRDADLAVLDVDGRVLVAERVPDRQCVRDEARARGCRDEANLERRLGRTGDGDHALAVVEQDRAVREIGAVRSSWIATSVPSAAVGADGVASASSQATTTSTTRRPANRGSPRNPITAPA